MMPPARGCSSPAISRSSVDFPQPLGPRSATKSPGPVRGRSHRAPQHDRCGDEDAIPNAKVARHPLVWSLLEDACFHSAKGENGFVSLILINLGVGWEAAESHRGDRAFRPGILAHCAGFWLLVIKRPSEQPHPMTQSIIHDTICADLRHQPWAVGVSVQTHRENSTDCVQFCSRQPPHRRSARASNSAWRSEPPLGFADAHPKLCRQFRRRSQ